MSIVYSKILLLILYFVTTNERNSYLDLLEKLYILSHIKIPYQLCHFYTCHYSVFVSMYVYRHFKYYQLAVKLRDFTMISNSDQYYSMYVLICV